MNDHPDIEELQDFAEELLPRRRREEIREHMEDCASCREELASIVRLLDDLAELPVEAQPSRDLWPQIHWRIGAEGQGEVRKTSRPRGIYLRAWQLAAAGVVLALFSGGMVWAFMSGGGPYPPSESAGPVGLALPAAYAEEYAAYQEYTDAVTELENVVEEGRRYLDPETVRVLEENLAIIDRAILESTEALAQDPGSKILRHLLSETMRRKLNLLQQAAEIIVANT